MCGDHGSRRVPIYLSLFLVGITHDPCANSLHFLSADVEEKVREEYKKDNQIDQREWYQEDDDSHLKNQVKPNIQQPDFKQKLEEARK